MSRKVIRSLTSGPITTTFEQAMAGIESFGFRQSIFEVERLKSSESGSTGKAAVRDAVAEEVIVLRPSATQIAYPQIKPGDPVHCTGLRPSESGSPTLYRVRRMAEGFSRRTMAERK